MSAVVGVRTCIGPRHYRRPLHQPVAHLHCVDEFLVTTSGAPSMQHTQWRWDMTGEDKEPGSQ